MIFLTGLAKVYKRQDMCVLLVGLCAVMIRFLIRQRDRWIFCITWDTWRVLQAGLGPIIQAPPEVDHSATDSASCIHRWV